ncbi:succinylglutamate desuccinylase/aspartoacylase family protein [Aestuariicella hydrocarbonica]|uniref:Succinylglutamate desuccinylase/aspartoacylase family protein n=1 Tax=Pseudomaricurvus hydrocarbonicus TaxID=1470433 RepID=A0A9E5JSN9_9GAMM|nr:succinylglutamate desuccinylase/aspartoacylase family protein [Aestuariicella hydrocarbonica]NHO64843.1 succinylglutamate desuccinylase/aspartoacylase family protein [Aestuariicella hydrocarbonica]
MEKLVIDGVEIRPGTQTQIEMPVAKLYTDTDISMPIHVVRAKKTGPTVFVSAAVHGDELNGVEIIRRLIKLKSLKITAGTLILVPMVNVYGVLNQSRYMPDRRDLNRTFPGSPQGSMAGRVADKFLTEIVNHCDYGIDLHTGAKHRSNLPQIRADLNDELTRNLADVFGVPVLLNANLRDGSLRQSALESGVRILLYEAGEALRFDELSIRAGVKGVMNVLSHLGMVRKKTSGRPKKVLKPFEANHSAWSRANCSGIVRNIKELGDAVQKNDALAEIGSPFGELMGTVRASRSGIIIGKQNIPLVQEGDAMFHIAYFSEDDDEIAERIETMQDTLLPEFEETPAED